MSLVGVILLGLLLAAVLAPLLWLLHRMVMRAEPQYYVQPVPPPGPPMCPGCGYALYYAKDQRCPECGRSFEVKELDMRLAEWDGQTLRPREPQDTNQQRS